MPPAPHPKRRTTRARPAPPPSARASAPTSAASTRIPAAASSVPRPRGRPRDPDLAPRRRDEILRCALRHFARSGFDRAVLDDIAAELACAKGTLYNYFPTKQALFTAAADLVMRELLAHTASSPSDDPLDRIVHAVNAYLAFFEKHPEYVELIIQERARFHERPRSTYFQYRDANAHIWRELLQQLMDAGRARPMPPQVAFDVIGDLLYGTIFTNHMSGRRRPLTQQARAVLDILFHGLLIPAPRKHRPSSARQALKLRAPRSPRPVRPSPSDPAPRRRRG